MTSMTSPLRITSLTILLCVFACSIFPAYSQTRATIKIDARKVENRISPLLYGQFLEFMFEGIKFGLHAELLRDRSFEDPANVIGLPRYWERYPDDRVDDYALKFHWDESTAYPSSRKDEHSLRVDSGEGVVKRHGIYQSGIPIRRGLAYRGYLWVKTESYSGRIEVALESEAKPGEIYATADLGRVEGNWRKYEFRLRPSQTDPLARLVISFSGRGRLWMDQVALLPDDAAPGEVRRDVFEQVKLLKPRFIRWPGGNVAQDYRWMWGIGPRDERVRWDNLSWKNESEPSDFGTDEFVMFSRAVGAEPSITVNVEGRGATVEEAAAWVEYCNGPTSSEYGAMRAANGHPETYNVKLWEIGNEIWGDWVRGHSSAEVYARNLQRYAKAMRAIDPGIKLIAVGDNNMDWNRSVLRIAGSSIDYLAVHHYYGSREMADDAGNLMARPLFYERFYAQMRELIHEVVPGREIKLAINEWGLDLPEERQYSMESALYAARLLNVFERSGDLVEMSAVSDLVNGWPGGIIQSGRQGLFVSPIFLVNQIYSANVGTERIATVVNGPTFDTSKEGKNIPSLDVSASQSSDGRRIFVKVVNTDGRNLTSAISVAGAAIGTRAELFTVGSSSWSAANSFANPNAVRTTQTKVQSGRTFKVNLPAHSVSVIVLNTQ
jgi:alpha-N-arabinofuranosidase